MDLKSMTIHDYSSKVLTHYLLLDKDFISTLNYVYLDNDNYETFSNIYLKQLLSIGSEIGFLMNELVNYYTGIKKDRDFPTCYSEIQAKSKYKLDKIKIGFRDERFSHLPIFNPWLDKIKDSKGKDHISWWYFYNKIKHSRLEITSSFNNNKEYYKYATLKNVLYSLAALFSPEFIAYREIHTNDNKKNKKSYPFVPLYKTVFKVTNLGWENYKYNHGHVESTDEPVFWTLND